MRAPCHPRTAAPLRDYLVLSLAYGLALVYALALITPFPLPEPMREVVLAAPSVWVIGITLMASALV